MPVDALADAVVKLQGITGRLAGIAFHAGHQPFPAHVPHDGQLQQARQRLLEVRGHVANVLEDPIAFDIAMAEQILVLPRLDDETTMPAFGHLFAGGYAAGYYSYKWAEVLAADAFAAFREAGLDDDEAVRAVAKRFRDTVLGLGGSRPAAEVYRLFRGRDATAAALLEAQGLVDTDAA